MSTSGGFSQAAAVVSNVTTGNVSVGNLAISSLTNASATGPGSVLTGDQTRCRSNPVMVVVSGAGVTAGAVQLQGSLDNVNWFNIGAAVSTTTANTVFPPVTAPGTVHVFLRANITTVITGGTISAQLGSSG